MREKMKKYTMEKSNEYNRKLRRYVAGGVHYNFRTIANDRVRHMVRGEKSRLWDMDGNEYLDLYAKFGAMILGHGNREYNEALKAQIDRVQAVNHCDLDLEVSEKIHELVPSIESIRFGLSGSEIVQNALRAARAYTGRNRFIRFEGHYHGNMDNIMGGTLSPDPSVPVPVMFAGDARDTLGRAEGILESQSFLLPWNDLPALEKTLQEYHENIAALIMEPVCFNGGGIMPLPDYLEGVRLLCDKYGIVLIFDEIITGFRASIGGAQSVLKVSPDLTVFGKAMAGGMPVSAVGGRKEIMRLFDLRKVVHAGTFNGYPLGMTAVKATLEILSRNDGAVYSSMSAAANALSASLINIANSAGLDFCVQGLGGARVFHCRTLPLTGREEPDFETVLKDSIVSRALGDFGILISPVSRMYMNVSSSAEDIRFLEEHAPAAFETAVSEMRESGILKPHKPSGAAETMKTGDRAPVKTGTRLSRVKEGM